MTLNLTSDQIIDKFSPGHDFNRLGFTAHELEFATEQEQEVGIQQYEQDGWAIQSAGVMGPGYFFKAIKLRK